MTGEVSAYLVVKCDRLAASASLPLLSSLLVLSSRAMSATLWVQSESRTDPPHGPANALSLSEI